MTKVELTISPDYVPRWTIVDAIRELFQNAIDQQEQYPDNEMSYEYESDIKTLTISNKSSELTAKSLLLGSTTKLNDKNTIGQFGEGYKIATLVLLRNRKSVTFYNYKANEIWRPRLVDSRKFGSKILTFFIEKCPIWKHSTSNSLVIEINGITETEWQNEIVPSNLHINGAEVLETTEFGDILKDLPGSVFVNGLFVCKYEPYKYGYNFKPQYIKLDRDRKMASDFDLKWLASKVWAKSVSQDECVKLIEDNAADVEYINNMYGRCLADTLFNRFIVKYGTNAIPVTCQGEMDALSSQYKGIMVSQTFKSIVVNASGYVVPNDVNMDPLDELDAWFQKVIHKLDAEDVKEFQDIYARLCR